MVKSNIRLAAVQNKPGIAQQATTPWACRHAADGSSIDAYIEGTGEWATIARVQPLDGLDAKNIAEHIVRAVNQQDKQQALLAEMALTLKLCMECKGISWEVEHDAEILIKRYEAMMK